MSELARPSIGEHEIEFGFRSGGKELSGILPNKRAAMIVGEVSSRDPLNLRIAID